MKGLMNTETRAKAGRDADIQAGAKGPLFGLHMMQDGQNPRPLQLYATALSLPQSSQTRRTDFPLLAGYAIGLQKETDK